MTREDVIKLARKLQRLAEHEQTEEAERDLAQARLQELLGKYHMTLEDLKEQVEELEPDELPADASYEEIWAAILDQIGLPPEELNKVIGSAVTGLLRKVWGKGYIIEDALDKTDETKLGRAVTTAALTLLRKGMK
jgi:predicted nuclease with TOPRIM domain